MCAKSKYQGITILKFYECNKSNSPQQLKKTHAQVLVSKHIWQIEICFKCSSYIKPRKKLFHFAEIHMKEQTKTRIQICDKIAES